MSGASYYNGLPANIYQRNDLVIGNTAANTSGELAVTNLKGVNSGDVGFVVPLAAPVVGFELTYFRGTGNDTGVIGYKNVSEGALDPADTMDVYIVAFRKNHVINSA